MIHHRREKSPFKTQKLRDLSDHENEMLGNIKQIIQGDTHKDNIGLLPGFISQDSQARPLVIGIEILQKVFGDHGLFDLHNFVINITSWEYVLVGVDGDRERINLIKIIPKSNNFLLIAARRANGYFMLTHFEIISKNGNELKNLLKRGDVLDRSGRTPSLIETGLPSC